MKASPDNVDDAAASDGDGLMDCTHVELTSDGGSDGAQETPYELLRRTVGSSTARLLREHLQESSRYDEDSYVHRQGRVFVAHLKMAANEIQEREQFLQRMQRVLDGAVQEIKEAMPTHPSKPASHGHGAAVTAWQKFFQRAATQPQTRVRRLLWVGGRWVGQHPLWTALAAVLVGTAVLWEGICLYEKNRALRFEAHELARLNAWQDQEEVKTKELRAQNSAAAQQEIAGQLEQRFKALEPTFYRLAEQLEKTARPLQLEDGKVAWEVTLTKEAGLLKAGMDPKNPVDNLLVYMAEDPNRWQLAKTSPAPATVDPKKNDKVKHR